MNFNLKKFTRQGGFTLVEVLVALVIFGVIAATVLKATQRSIRQQRVMEERLAANWVAKQVLSQIRLESPWPPVTEEMEEATFAGRDWEILIRVEETSDERIRHIIIEVSYLNAETPTLTLDAWAAEE